MKNTKEPFWKHLQIITKKELCQIVPYSPQHIGLLEKKGKFPKRIRLGGNRVGWVWFEIEAWILDRMDERPATVLENAKDMTPA